MLGVYNYMAAGILLTGVVAFVMFSMLTTNDPPSPPRRCAMASS